MREMKISETAMVPTVGGPRSPSGDSSAATDMSVPIAVPRLKMDVGIAVASVGAFPPNLAARVTRTGFANKPASPTLA